ncbi:MAG: hypothetical protein AAF937_10770 [Planctomycetota bacterium]
MPKLCRSILAAVSLAGCVHAQGVPAGYTLVELRPLGGGTESFVSSINDRGEIVGRTEFGTGPVATRWDLAGSASLITFLGGGSATDAVSINNEGSMLVECGSCVLGFGVRLTDGTLLALPPVPPMPGSGIERVAPSLTSSGSVGGVFTAVNDTSGNLEAFAVQWELDSGPQITVADVRLIASPLDLGSRTDGVLASNGVQYFGGSSGGGSAEVSRLDVRTDVLTDIAPLGIDFAEIIGANSANQFVSVEALGRALAAVFYSAGDPPEQIIPINCDDFPDPNDCFAKNDAPLLPAALNENGLVVGSSIVLADLGDGFPIDVGNSAFVWSSAEKTVDLADKLIDPSADGWSLVDPSVAESGPSSINTLGMIVGNGINPMGQPAAYVLIPRPPCAADVNRNGEVAPNDFNAWILAFNNGCD